MEKRRLGNSDLYLSVIGMGCWQYGGGAYWGEQNQQDVNDVVARAIDIGINYFDTAEVYNDGESETSLGLALKGKRDKVMIGSKISPSNTRYKDLVAHCDASLRRLQTDYLDLYMLHWPINSLSVAHFTNNSQMIDQPPNVHEVMESLSSLQKQGKIRHIGISNHGVLQMEELGKHRQMIAANELAYNLFSRAIEQDILPYCNEHDIGVIAYMPLQQGLLTGKYQSADEIKPMQARSRHFHHSRGQGTRHGEEGAEQEIFSAVREINKLAGEWGVNTSTLSLAWVLANPGITTTIVGSRNIQQLELNSEGARCKLSSEVIERLNRITEPTLARLGNNPDYYENRQLSRIK